MQSDRGAHSAESAGDRRPSYLIWVMPAQEARSFLQPRRLRGTAAPAMTCVSSRYPLGGIMNNRWRTIDIVIASIVAVAFGVIFWAWGLLWNGPADAIPLPGRAAIYGMWLVPAVLGALIVR